MNYSLLSRIGNTPLIELTKFDTGKCRLFVKLEDQNPGGSIKDRIALYMIEAAEKRGDLKPGYSIIEATAGNTGLGLALVGVLKGYKITLVIPDKMSREKIRHLRALGCEIILTPSNVHKGHPEHYQDRALALSKTRKNCWYVSQFTNPDNPKAHELSTGPEILRQLPDGVDAVVCGVGSGGTVTGLGKCFAAHSPKTELVLADPEGSILAEILSTGKTSKEAGAWLVEGIGGDVVPDVCNLKAFHKSYTIPDRESMEVGREMLRREGILAGASTGTLVAAALRYCREQTSPKTVVTFVCDSGNKYLSKMFDDYWMRDQGLTDRKTYGDLRDVLAVSNEDGSYITVSPNDTLQVAFARMKVYDISQIPVVEGEKICGILDEEDLIITLADRHENMTKLVREVMTTGLETLPPSAPVSEVVSMLKRGLVPVVVENGKFIGLITKMDLINYLRRSNTG